MKINQGNYFNQYQVNNFVVVKYGDQKYPGKIIDVDVEEFCISKMVKKSKFWSGKYMWYKHDKYFSKL